MTAYWPLAGRGVAGRSVALQRTGILFASIVMMGGYVGGGFVISVKERAVALSQ